MAKVIIPHEYIIDGDGKDVGIDIKYIYRIDDISGDDFKCSKLYYYRDDNSKINYFNELRSDEINIDLSLPEVCALIADAIRTSGPEILTMEGRHDD